ncbi:hypothetical protein MHYP_G00090440 [Metynnis hypsauchen]
MLAEAYGYCASPGEASDSRHAGLWEGTPCWGPGKGSAFKCAAHCLERAKGDEMNEAKTCNRDQIFQKLKEKDVLARLTSWGKVEQSKADISCIVIKITWLKEASWSEAAFKALAKR